MSGGRPRRVGVWLLAGLAVVVAVSLIGPGRRDGPPLDPSSTGPTGTRAILDVLRELEVDVRLAGGVPDAGDVALVVTDTMSPDQREDLRRWVRDGGHLVLVDPLSPLAPGVSGVTSIAFTEPTIEPDCEDPAVAGVERVSVADAFVLALPPGASGCFPRNDGHWMIREPVGEGEQVMLGGAFTLTNAELDRVDNAVLLVNLLTPPDGGSVHVVEGDDPDGRGETLSEVLPDQVRVALWQVPLVWAVLVWWRARRHGRPVGEVPPVSLDAADTVLATGNLLHRAGQAGEAAALVRHDLDTAVRRRLGLPEHLHGDPLVVTVAERTGIPEVLLRRALLDPLPGDDAGLLALAALAGSLRRRLTTPARTASPTPTTGAPT